MTSSGNAALVVALVGVVLAGEAQADGQKGTNDRDADTGTRSSFGMDVTVGTVPLDDDALFAGGFRARRGRHVGRFAVFGEAHLFRVSTAEDTMEPALNRHGLLGRAGLSAQLSLWRPQTTRKFALRGDFWIEAGLGWQLGILEDRRVSRPDLTLGVGAQYDLLAFDRGSQSREFTAVVSLRTIRPMDAPETRGWIFSVGWLWR